MQIDSHGLPSRHRGPVAVGLRIAFQAALSAICILVGLDQLKRSPEHGWPQIVAASAAFAAAVLAIYLVTSTTIEAICAQLRGTGKPWARGEIALARATPFGLRGIAISALGAGVIGTLLGPVFGHTSATAIPPPGSNLDDGKHASGAPVPTPANPLITLPSAPPMPIEPAMPVEPGGPGDPVVPSIRESGEITSVVVMRGDSLWQIAAKALGGSSGNAAIATECHRWYEANRDVIGTNPDRLLPGQILTSPTN